MKIQNAKEKYLYKKQMQKLKFKFEIKIKIQKSIKISNTSKQYKKVNHL
jgi:hypothetical protein